MVLNYSEKKTPTPTQQPFIEKLYSHYKILEQIMKEEIAAANLS